MKKYLLGILIVFASLIVVGCGKNTQGDIVNNLSKRVEKTEGYFIEGELEIVNNEDSYKYDVVVAYAKDNNFKVTLKNKINQHEQIILKNADGVYVLTPSLNKSFKFQSEWPYNTSQVYLLQTILRDLKNDSNRVFEETEDGYVFTTSVNYSNNKNMVKQKIFLDKSSNIKEVQVLNENDIVQIKMMFNNIDYKATYDNTYFTLNGNMKTGTDIATNKTIESIVYPMYMPANTHLTGQEKIPTTNGERVILTFNGDNPFMIVQETVTIPEDFLTIPVYGEPYVVTGTVGALSDSSITWSSNGVDYYVVSDILEASELLEIANSINTATVGK